MLFNANSNLYDLNGSSKISFNFLTTGERASGGITTPILWMKTLRLKCVMVMLVSSIADPYR